MNYDHKINDSTSRELNMSSLANLGEKKSTLITLLWFRRTVSIDCRYIHTSFFFLKTSREVAEYSLFPGTFLGEYS